MSFFRILSGFQIDGRAGWLRRSCVFMGLIVGTWSVGGQQPPSEPSPASASSSSPSAAADSQDLPTETIVIRVDEVSVPVTVYDSKDRLLIGLTKSDFNIYEDGKRQEISYFRRETDVPLRVGLLLDTSNSARRHLTFEKDAASEFAYVLLQRSRRHKLFLLTFDASLEVVQDFTNDRDKLNESIQDLKAGGGKAFYDALYFACKDMMVRHETPRSTRRVLVVISDGNDAESEHSLEEVISMARLAEVVIYTIGTTSYGFANPGDKFLKRLSRETGGQAGFPLKETYGADMRGYQSSGSQFPGTSQNRALSKGQGVYSAERFVQMIDSLEGIRRELEEQYVLAYKPQNSTLDGTYRTIQVRVRRKGAKVRSKKGYFAISEDRRWAMAEEPALIESATQGLVNREPQEE